ncbi:hypothetical protein M3Y97_00351600 [Aphelenchoides bicaudatus]|nr:hypothetical protein M3Y97_00351600 [Aphelenchoides bicaudatus]
MDPKIKEELIGEIQQLNIKKKEEDFFSVMVFRFSSFRIANASIDSNVAGDVTVDHAGMTINDVSLDNNMVYEFLHRDMHFSAVFTFGEFVVFTLEGITLQLFNRNNQPCTVPCTLTVNFGNWEQAKTFGRQLIDVGYSQV